jgi:hypothetical protein
MTTLREAAQEFVADYDCGGCGHFAAYAENFRKLLAEQEQAEPVLVVEKEPDYMSRGHFYEGSKPFIDPTEVWKLPIGTKLYTRPPRREWQGLTEEDMEDLLPLYSDPSANTEMLEFAASIEVKLKEKNQ